MKVMGSGRKRIELRPLRSHDGLLRQALKAGVEGADKGLTRIIILFRHLARFRI